MEPVSGWSGFAPPGNAAHAAFTGLFSIRRLYFQGLVELRGNKFKRDVNGDVFSGGQRLRVRLRDSCTSRHPSKQAVR
jgi:hypothetical protein